MSKKSYISGIVVLILFFTICLIFATGTPRNKAFTQNVNDNK